jgi:MYXO-CTERM domain-containing protein
MGACATVQAGTNHASACSGNVAALCNATSYPAYDSANHTMGVANTSPAANARGTAWDVGAYQYCEGTSCAMPDGGVADASSATQDGSGDGGSNVAQDGGVESTHDGGPGAKGGSAHGCSFGGGQPASLSWLLALAMFLASRRRRSRGLTAPSR